MADKKQLSLKPCTANSRAGASGLQMMNGGEVFSSNPSTTKSFGFSLQPCRAQVEEEAFTGEEAAPKRKAAKGCATKRKGGRGRAKREGAADEEAAAVKAADEEAAAVKAAAVTVAADETMDQEDAAKFNKRHEERKARFEAHMQKLFGGGPGSVPVNIVKYPRQEEEELGVVDDGNLRPVAN